MDLGAQDGSGVCGVCGTSGWSLCVACPRLVTFPELVGLLGAWGNPGAGGYLGAHGGPEVHDSAESEGASGLVELVRGIRLCFWHKSHFFPGLLAPVNGAVHSP